MITETAIRKIVRALNNARARNLAGNGQLVFDRDGNGGQWYSDNSYGFGDGNIAISVPYKKATGKWVGEYIRYKYFDE